MPNDLNFASDTANADSLVQQPRRIVDLTEPVQALAEPVIKHGVLNYDFDIVAVPPDAAQKAHLAALAELGQSTDDLQVEARWRDPRTVAAVRNAGQAAQDILHAAGFGSVASDCRVPVGEYPAEQGLQRHDVIMRLTNLLADSDASQFDWGTFNCMELFKAHAEAVPVRTAISADMSAAIQTSSTTHKRKLALIVCVIGLALLVVAVASAL